MQMQKNNQEPGKAGLEGTANIIHKEVASMLDSNAKPAPKRLDDEKPKYGIPEIFWHHGTCDLCGDEYVLVCHFGYQAKTMKEPNYRICKNCMHDRLVYIIYGSNDYNDGLVGRRNRIRRGDKP